MAKENIEESNDSGYESSLNKLSKLRGHHIIKGDSYLWIATILLMALSLLLIYSSTISLQYQYHPDEPYFFVFRRLRDVFIALIVLFFFSHYNINRLFNKFIDLFFWVSCGALLLTLFFGDDVNNATRTLWGVQTSDFAKVALILMIAKQLTIYKDVLHKVRFIPKYYLLRKVGLSKGRTAKENRWLDERARRSLYQWKKYALHFVYPIALVCGLIMVSDLSTAAVTAVIVFVLMVIGGIYYGEIIRFIGSLFVVFLVIAPLGGFNRLATWITRLTSFLSGSSGDDPLSQVAQAKSGIARGLIPQGPGGSLLRSTLPRAESDYAFVIIVEEYGTVVAAVICLIYLWILQRAVQISRRLDNRFEALACVGLALFLTFQGLIHCMVNVNLLPVTGLVLPFLSHGGWGLVSMSLAMAMILNISTHVKRN